MNFFIRITPFSFQALLSALYGESIAFIYGPVCDFITILVTITIYSNSSFFVLAAQGLHQRTVFQKGRQRCDSFGILKIRLYMVNLLVCNADITGNNRNEMIRFQFADCTIIRPYADADLIGYTGIGNRYGILCLLSVIGDPVIQDINHQLCAWIVKERMVIAERRFKKFIADRVQNLIAHLPILPDTL